jgi:hypothetical protein
MTQTLYAHMNKIKIKKKKPFQKSDFFCVLGTLLLLIILNL